MKKCAWAAAAAALVILLCRAPAARAGGQLPLDIRAQFGAIEIVDTAQWDGNGSTWFVLVRTPDHVNRLLCYTLENGAWTQQFQTAAALPQGDGRVRIVITDRSQDFTLNRVTGGPILLIMQYGTGEYESSVIQHHAFARSENGEWLLFSAFFTEEQWNVAIDENEVIYHKPMDRDQNEFHTVPVRLERNLRHADLTAVPRTPEAAEAKIPEEPAGTGSGQ